MGVQARDKAFAEKLWWLGHHFTRPPDLTGWQGYPSAVRVPVGLTWP